MMFYCLHVILFLLLSAVYIELVRPSRPVDDYAVVIDAGSTGSRCFVFHVTVDSEDVRKLSSFSCGKADRGISSYLGTPHELASCLAPLLLNAAKILPISFHLKTTVYIKATAGMRLLSLDEQHVLWSTLIYDLNRRVDIPFLVYPENIGTIDGHSEAFFAVLASNYIAGSIDGNLQ
jgi:Golgi apyrase